MALPATAVVPGSGHSETSHLGWWAGAILFSREGEAGDGVAFEGFVRIETGLITDGTCSQGPPRRFFPGARRSILDPFTQAVHRRRWAHLRLGRDVTSTSIPRGAGRGPGLALGRFRL